MDYENIEIKIGQLADYSVALKLNNESLGEVVVIGYGTQKRTTLTGAIATKANATKPTLHNSCKRSYIQQPSIDNTLLLYNKFRRKNKAQQDTHQPPKIQIY